MNEGSCSLMSQVLLPSSSITIVRLVSILIFFDNIPKISRKVRFKTEMSQRNQGFCLVNLHCFNVLVLSVMV